MSYVLNQFNQPMTEPSSVDSAENQSYMTVLISGTAKRKMSSADSGVSGGSLEPFSDECVQFDSALRPGINYYFHAKIKRLLSDQILYMYLINYNDNGEKTQYIKTITIQGGKETEWIDFETIFSPIIAFDAILFKMQRTIEDYREAPRHAVIVYEELSRVNNLISSKIRSGISLLKMGIQSRPGLMMCINGEEIHIGRTGTYEIRNGVILVDFFSVIVAAKEDPNGRNPLINPSTGDVVTLDEYLAYLAGLPAEEGENTNSSCIFNKSKTRLINSFTLDYMYEEEE